VRARRLTAPPAQCPYQRCPGCPRFGAVGLETQALGRLEAFARDHHVALSTHVGARSAFRLRSRLSVRGRSDSARVGLFEAGTHRVADIPDCSVHHPAINRVAAALKRSLRLTGATCYRDLPHTGLVRGLQVAIERSSARAQVVLITNSAEPSPASALLQTLENALGTRLHSLWWNGNPERTNRILGPHWHLRIGPEALTEPMGGAQVFFPPGAFGQNNLEAVDTVIAELKTWLEPGCPIVELYSGVGTLSLGLAKLGHPVTFNEISPDSLHGLQLGLAALEPDERDRCGVIPGSAEVACPAITPDSTVILDPPRKGLDPGVVAALIERRPTQVIYLSCGLESFLRDAEALTGGGFTVKAVQAHDFFPFTEHLETLALFQRA
jgi:23S rRNA (uracil1939-C5)-methyltransferase